MPGTARSGALLVEWEPDADRGEDEATVMWVVLHPSKWPPGVALASTGAQGGGGGVMLVYLSK